MRHRISLTTVATAFIWLCAQSSIEAAVPIKSVINPGDLVPIVAAPVGALSTYVESCKTALGFDTIPQFDCRDELFRPPGDLEFSRSNDFVAHRTINSAVDTVFACRWVRSNTGTSKAASGEMLVHNRLSGKTCFFRLNETNKTVPDSETGALAVNEPTVATTNPPSPTDSNAAAFWDTELGVRDAGCTRCHSAGPYIASPQIVGALAKFGLINDGHDTSISRYQAIGAIVAPSFNRYIHTLLQPNTSALHACSSACHVIGGDPVQNSDASVSNDIVIPSINLVIDDIRAYMPPTNDPYSDYRWINRDDPGFKGDYERLSDVQVEYPQFYCSNPTSVQAHEVGSAITLSTDDLPNVLNTFNLYDGLVCLNAEQRAGTRCANYETRYKCSGRWTAWNSSDTPGSTGDYERRSKFPGLCANPTSMQARVVNGPNWGYAPRDRLNTFSSEGLICRNADQPAGESCNNYVVRFICQ